MSVAAVSPPFPGSITFIRLSPTRFPSNLLVGSRKFSRRWTALAFYGEGYNGGIQRDAPHGLSLDSVLAVAEVLCIAPPVSCSIMNLVGLVFPGTTKQLQQLLSARAFGWQFNLLVAAVAIGALIRHRQWQRICQENGAASGVNFLARLKKVEEDLQSSGTIIRVLSRQLEKLGIRFRVTRKALKDPISETAALSQKNSEATRALAMREDILEKELGEIQKVLLAMQEQQQKQLELILAIGKAGKLFESKQKTVTKQPILDNNNSVSRNKVVNEAEVQ